VFCRVGVVVRKNTSKYKLNMSIYGCTKSIMLYEGREMCISHRPTTTYVFFIFWYCYDTHTKHQFRSRSAKNDTDVFQRIHQKTVLHEDIHIKVSEASTSVYIFVSLYLSFSLSILK